MTVRIDWLLLINAMLGNFLAGVSSRIFMISLPSVANGLGTDILGISWALISFQLASISLSIVFGRLGDLYGRDQIYGLGFVIMTVSSFLCGIAQNVLQLIVFRFFQGVGGAMTQSCGRVLAMEAMPERSGGKAQGLMTMAFHSGFFVGPSLGGVIIDYFNWRGIFFFLVPIAMGGATLTYQRLKRSGPPALAGRPSVDYRGAALFIALMVMLTLLLDRRTAGAAGMAQKGVLMLAFAGALWGFLLHENRTPSPMMNLSLFRIPMFTCSIVSLVTISISHGLVSFLMPFYLQEVLRLSPSFIGIIYLAPPIFTITLATLSGHITDRVGPRIPATIGVIFSIAACGVGAVLRTDSPWILPTAVLGLTGMGTSFFNSPNHAAIIGSVPPGDRGFATGMTHTMFGLGHMLGISLGGVLLSLTFQYYSGIPGAIPTPENPPAFVSSMNTSYLAALSLGLVALFFSLMRGGATIGAARLGAHSVSR